MPAPIRRLIASRRPGCDNFPRASPKPCLSTRRGTGHTSRVFFTESALALHIAAAGRLGHFLFHLNLGNNALLLKSEVVIIFEIFYDLKKRCFSPKCG